MKRIAIAGFVMVFLMGASYAQHIPGTPNQAKGHQGGSSPQEATCPGVLAEDGRCHGLGVVPEPEGALPARVWFGGCFTSGAMDPLPSSWTNDIYLPPVGDQGQQGSCVAWAAAYYAATYEVAKAHGWDPRSPEFQLSPAYLYNQGQIPGGGVYWSDAFELLHTFGSATMALMPYRDDDSQTWPSENAYREAMNYRSEYPVALSRGNDDFVDQIKAYLTTGNIGVAEIHLYDNFLSITGFGSTYCLSDVTDTSGYHGLHATTILGYDDTRTTHDGIGAFRCVNSWGTAWGDSGYYWLSYQAVADPSSKLMTGHFYAFTPREPSGYAARIEWTETPVTSMTLMLGKGSWDTGFSAARLWGLGSYSNANYPCPGHPIWVDFDLADFLPGAPQDNYFLMFGDWKSMTQGTGQLLDFSIWNLCAGSHVASAQVPAAIPAAPDVAFANLAWPLWPACPSSTVTGVDPSSGPPSGGTPVTITGSGFTGATAVSFGFTQAPSFNVISDGEIWATSPPLAEGTVDVTVTTPEGVTPSNPLDRFTASCVGVTSVNPDRGRVAGGSLVTLTGWGFDATALVRFGDTTVVPSSVSADGTTILVTNPPHAEGTVAVTVTAACGTSTPAALAQFTYSDLYIVRVFPDWGPSSGDTPVDLMGWGFSGATAVYFGAVRCPRFTVLNDRHISVASPPHSAGKVHITVVRAGIPSRWNPADGFTFEDRAITSLSPTSGPIDGGTLVTLQGWGFAGATSVRFGSEEGAIVSVTPDGSQLVAQTPAHAAGTVNVVVATPQGTTEAGPSAPFIYTCVGVASVEPMVGPSGASVTVVLDGWGFGGATSVRFGEVPALSFTVLSPTQIVAVAPPQPEGEVPVTVETPCGEGPAGSFLYSCIGVSALAPDSGPPEGGTRVTITGWGFTGATAVLFGDVPASFVVQSDSQIRALSPDHRPRAVTVSVLGPCGQTIAVPAAQFTYTCAPAVNGIRPQSGPETGGTSVTLTGSRMTGAEAVLFGDTPAASFIVESDKRITAVSPAHAPGTVDVRVVNACGASPVSGNDLFSFTCQPAILELSPSVGSSAGGTLVTLTGTSLSGATSVTFGGVPALSFTQDSEDQITAVAPPHATGRVRLVVTTPCGVSGNDAAAQYTYTCIEVTGVLPSFGPTAGGTQVTITGWGFAGATAVTFGGRPASSFSVQPDGTITAVSPAHTAGPVDIRVTVPCGTSAAVPADLFTYSDCLPIVTAVSPGTGSSNGDSKVAITGSHFTGATAVYFGDMPAPSFTVRTDGWITAASPAHPPGPVAVTVVTPCGTTPVDAAGLFTYCAAPMVLGVSPDHGYWSGGTTVILAGGGFTGATQVLFGDTPAASFHVDASYRITAVSPPHAIGTVDIVVSTGCGTSAVGSSDQFTFTEIPYP